MVHKAINSTYLLLDFDCPDLDAVEAANLSVE